MDRILILLDSEQERRMLGKALEGDFRITLCDTIPEVSDYLGQDYHALILDLLLPGTDGFSVLTENRNTLPPVVILLTYLITPEILEQAQAAGVTAILRKPYKMAYLRNCLIRQLAKKDPSHNCGRGNGLTGGYSGAGYSKTHT